MGWAKNETLRLMRANNEMRREIAELQARNDRQARLIQTLWTEKARLKTRVARLIRGRAEKAGPPRLTAIDRAEALFKGGPAE
ncbi:hypothetical protein AN189_07335 [Loktanella sp. 3ANDIMAR09]|uniref:hypothetical protein n=1 Tax=Loktanella sp. 3ANDIMAR09 TaxID=1225657 RepID=UPI0006F2E053|nr:hypothetical protein [Loktanella sp. 3ANDIMAR09]KQI68706.1 hypothetical protein AN189_07335 [Loktanella sp. 3ANDIMAR09]